MEKIGKDEFIRQPQKSLLKDGIELSLNNLDKIVDSVLSTKTTWSKVIALNSQNLVNSYLGITMHVHIHDLQRNAIEVEAHETPAFEPGDSFKEMLRK